MNIVDDNEDNGRRSKGTISSPCEPYGSMDLKPLENNDESMDIFILKTDFGEIIVMILSFRTGRTEQQCRSRPGYALIAIHLYFEDFLSISLQYS